ncbi:zinc ribbon domain-containing protein [Amycolatopsis sp. NPDC004079]|uniref:zinc ribbon domain-containing protein n=1 Tax=Amycolatopsis sp. NPDC004079 TaxID=3154549 RepID=UPI0033A1FEA4
MAVEDRPNAFVALGIDPDAPWDPAGYEVALQTKRAEWSRDSDKPLGSAKATAARRALDSMDEFRRVLADPAAREQERAAARRIMADERVRRAAAFDSELGIMLAKGFLWDAELAKLHRDHPVPSADRDRAERLAGLPVRDVSGEFRVPERLDPSTAKSIAGLLAAVGEKSLYTLLFKADPTVGAKSPLPRLHQAAKRLSEKNLNREKHLPGVAETQALAGHAMSIFASEKEQARYDNTLALAPVDELMAKYQSALNAIKRFEPGQVDQFLAEAVAAGAEADVARAMLMLHFGRLKWVVPFPADADPEEAARQRCEACQARNDPENQFCLACGVRLRIECPACARTVSGHGSCGGCGFPVGDYDWAALLARECAEAAGRDDLAAAEEKLAAAKRAWPSDGADELAVRLGECGEQVNRLREQVAAEERRVVGQVRTLIGQRNYHAVRNRVTDARATLAGRDQFLREATEHIDEADRLCDRADRAADVQEQLAGYALALAQCADHQRARRAINALPPESPHDLRAEPAGAAIRLSWQPSDSDNPRYVVVRKTGDAPPATLADGVRLATVRRTAYEDRAPEPGIPLHYTVFAQRVTGIVSETGAATAEPAFVAGEISLVSQRVGDGTVELEWRLPVHAVGAAVQRTTGGQTTDIAPLGLSRLRDEGLANDVPHTYTVRAVYPGRLSRGVTVSLVPCQPPEPPGPVRVRTVPGNLGLCYRIVDLLPQGAGPDSATVLWTQHRPRIRAGEQYSVTELAKSGSLIDAAAAEGFALPRAGLYYFAQVVLRNGVGYVGQIRRYAARDEVGGLEARDRGGAVLITWKWPDGCRAAVVACGRDDWPPDPADAPSRTVVERAGDEETGSYRFDGAASGRKVFVVVAAAEIREDEVFVATGVRCSAEAAPAKRRKWKRKRA